MKTDLKQLAVEIQEMKPRSELFKVLKRELKSLGYWRNLPRGNPRKGYEVMKQKLEGSQE